MKKGIVAICITLLGIFGLPIANVQAVTNSWITGGNFWDNQSSWSVGNYPHLSDAADFIMNPTNKTVTIDENDAAFVQDSLTISNLTVGGTGSTTNTLSLNNMTFGAAVPLHILNVMTITNGGVLSITNSMLQVDGMFNLSGSMTVSNGASIQFQNAIIATNAVMKFTLGTNNTAVAVINNLTLGGTVNIVNGGGFTNNTYTLFTYGGVLTNNGLAVGTGPSNFTFSVDTSTLGLVKLVVSSGVSTGTPSSTVVITSIAQQGNDILIAWKTSGAGTTNIVEVTSGTGDGSYSNNFTSLSGNIAVTGTTTNYLDVGGATNSPSRFYRIRATGTASSGITDTVGDGIPDSWRQQYFGTGTTTNANSCASCDPDGDGLSNFGEYLAGTSPINSMSGLRVVSTVLVNDDIVVTWLTAGGHTNILQATGGGGYSTNFVDIPASLTIVGGVGDTITNYTDVGGATNSPSRFYRVRLVP